MRFNRTDYEAPSFAGGDIKVMYSISMYVATGLSFR